MVGVHDFIFKMNERKEDRSRLLKKRKKNFSNIFKNINDFFGVLRNAFIH